MPKRILIPLDGSDFSRQIFSQVRKIFSPQETEVVLLRVIPQANGIVAHPPRPVSADIPMPVFESASDIEYANHPIYASQALETLEAETLEALEVDARNLKQAGYTVSTECRLGDAAQEIVKFVENEKIDAIAMTTHGRSGMSEIIFGSVAHAVLRSVNVPVMLWRPGK